MPFSLKPIKAPFALAGISEAVAWRLQKCHPPFGRKELWRSSAGSQALSALTGSAPASRSWPHMPDVEEPGFRARVEVLIEDAEGYCTGISKPAKGTIFCAKGEMERVDGVGLSGGGSKGRSVLPAAVLLPESFRGGCSFGPAPSRGGAYSAACSAPAGPGGQSQVSVLPGSPAVPRCLPVTQIGFPVRPI